MSYDIVKVVNEQNDELGWAISKDNMLKLTSIHLYESYFAVKEEVVELNKRALLSNFWPDPKDPEVKAIIDDPDFFTIDQQSQSQLPEYTSLEPDPSPSFERLYEACSLVAHRRAGL
jgi:hypothetical protein